MTGSPHPHIKRETISPLSEPKWDQLVERFADVEVFHKTPWANVLSATYGYRPQYLVFKDGETVVGILPIMEVSNWFSGGHGVSLPFTDCCPFLTNGGEVLPEHYLASILDQSRSMGWNYIELRLDAPIFQKRPSLEFYSHSLDLSIGETPLFERCSSGVRRAIRKARHERVEVAFLQGVDGAREYYKLHCLTRQRHGLPPQPWSFFRSLGQSCLTEKNGFVTIASTDGRAVAGAVFLVAGGRAHYKFGASDARFQTSRGNNLVMWESICHLIRTGVRSMSFGRTSLGNEGLRRFKLGWGCQERRLYYYRLEPGSGRVLPMIDRAKGFHNAVFRRLPIPLLRLIGRAIYAHQS